MYMFWVIVWDSYSLTLTDWKKNQMKMNGEMRKAKFLN